MGKGIRFLDMVKPVMGFLPEIQAPDRKIPFVERVWWTLGSLFIFLVCCQIPLYGVTQNASVDPLYWARVILASNKGSLMELGTAPIITSSMVMQLLAGAKIIEVDQSLSEDRQLFSAAQKFFGIILTLGEAIAYVVSGAYGYPSDIGYINAILIVIQLVCAGLLVMMLDELLQKGYGLGSGISLFIACNICENIIWKAFSPTTINTGKGTEFEGAVINFFHIMMTKSNKIDALRDAFYRDTAPNMTNLLATLIVFGIVVYLQGFRIELKLTHQKMRGSEMPFPIKLFYTSNIPIILQTALVSNLHTFSQILYRKFRHNLLVNILGQWQDVDIGGRHSIAVGGFAYYITPPRTLNDIRGDPLHCLCYMTFVLVSCAMFSKAWIDVSGQSPKDVAKHLRDQQLAIKGHRGESIISVLNKYIPPAAALGGICIGALTILADFMGAIGSGTGVLLGVSILYGYYELLMKDQGEGEVL